MVVQQLKYNLVLSVDLTVVLCIPINIKTTYCIYIFRDIVCYAISLSKSFLK